MFGNMFQSTKHGRGDRHTNGYQNVNAVFWTLRDLQLGRCKVDSAAEIVRLRRLAGVLIVEIVHVRALVQVFNGTSVVVLVLGVGREQGIGR